MKIEIFKKDNDENVYYKIGTEEKVLNFDNIKEMVVSILKNKLSKNDQKIKISVEDSSLDLYKLTMENIVESIKNDDDLYKLYEEVNKAKPDKK